MSCGTQVPACLRQGLRLRGCHPLRPGFPAGSADLVLQRGAGPTTPSVPCDTHGLGSSAFARHYSRNHFYFLLLEVLRCFSSLRLPLHAQMSSLQLDGLPHSDIHGSMIICISPWLFAAYHVLLRLREPRHPPSALAYFLLPSRPLQTVSGSIFLQLALLFLFFLVVQHVKDLFCLPPDCSGFQLIVENNGFEPLTLCVQSRCSSQLS